MGTYMTFLNRWFGLAMMLGLMMLGLVACSSRSLNRAPVEERTAGPAASAVASTSLPAVELAPVNPPQGFENAGKPGYYTVKPGDTLRRIAMDNGQKLVDVARWSQVENPDRIEVGQVLRVVPPGNADVMVKPVSRPVIMASPSDAAASAAAPAVSSASAPVPVSSKPAANERDLDWIWPANGALLAGFDEVKNKGLDIGGNAGDPIVAAADGRVVYVGASLRGYGNLIILKHNNVYLTAYAHNQTLLVKEDQTVLKGQKIAEMGKSDADRVKLHFEVRHQGKPVDPAKYLPAR